VIFHALSALALIDPESPGSVWSPGFGAGVFDPSVKEPLEASRLARSSIAPWQDVNANASAIALMSLINEWDLLDIK